MVELNFFKRTELALFAGDIEQKLEMVEKLQKELCQGILSFDNCDPVRPMSGPSYQAFCTIVDPGEVPSRKRVKSREGMGALLHAIIHIEYSAIDLALDAAYRYRSLPEQYYIDWLQTALEEVTHFRMLRTLLSETGYEYGQLPVHSAIYDASYHSRESLLKRMAVIPRFLEANGLDVNPRIMARLNPNDDLEKRLLEALHVILQEEILHVQRGDRWFKFACRETGNSSELFFDLVEEAIPGSVHFKKFINVQDRLKAGYSCEEIQRLNPDAICEQET